MLESLPALAPVRLRVNARCFTIHALPQNEGLALQVSVQPRKGALSTLRFLFPEEGREAEGEISPTPYSLPSRAADPRERALIAQLIRELRPHMKEIRSHLMAELGANILLEAQRAHAHAELAAQTALAARSRARYQLGLAHRIASQWRAEHRASPSTLD